MAASRGRSRLRSTLQHGVWVLDALGREGQLTAKELAERLGLNLRATYDILVTLEHEGCVSHFPNGEYGLGGRVPSLQLAFAQILAPAEIVTTALVDLHRRTGAGVSVNSWYGNDIVVQRQLRDDSDLSRPPIEAGYRDSPTTRCTTKAILAFLPEGQLLRYLASRPQSTIRASVVEPLREQLQRVVRRGYAVDLGETNREWYGVAAPFFDEHAFPIGSFGISLRRNLFKSRSQELCREVVAAAEKLSTKLGYRGVYPPPSPLFAGADHDRRERLLLSRASRKS